MARRTAATDVCRTVMQRLSVASSQKPQERDVLSMFAAASTDFVAQQRTSVGSNCVLNPKPPVGGASVGIRQNKMIGYYESWSARKSCHKVAPTDLPLDALTHVNFAFAYIEPSTYQVVTMDGSTPASLFQDTTNLKSIKQDIKVFVSIGGWTFSDNDTSTQPLFGEIAADATKRQTFADNVVHFMKQYGFDGVDIDWEYPGAPDRRGNPEDTENYVLLLKAMRETFDSSGSAFGLTFTAPSSYWYLRWFDLPNMIKYADWVNLMSYDLHGAWDATNPIGSIVQAHTNLTEIKLATDLFWRVNIPPSKLVMGFGFYGRSFTLSDPACTDPGCPFSGASKPGPCSDTGGILAYYEIIAALDGSTSSSKRATISPTHDQAAAVNYFTFDKNQWVSYDDATTFKQKVDWADSVGLGGGMIWASDLDTDKYTAHGALTGKTIQSNPSLQAVNKALSNPVAVVEDLAGSNGQKCFVYSGKCINLNDNKAMSDACGSGNTVVGWDDAGCGKKNCHCGKPVCCPTNSAPKSCIWRGDDNGGGAGSDCSAQCRPGEINIKGIRSSWGGRVSERR
ncbi:glycoside hydrolase family 18 protein [Aspergillus clavatus NRRL 1]|uniref:chitinase n=1 Tax=Aspergillus clavatus (strain ATCC 1007 / CBS 513.65 / DSM 816 / NCTC 3887 / NRRL 1 / QM 1276 / 107) TaxID=344612 RepID=A1C5T6_ASPCL|nr:bacteriodes thetaiotaomicron symbiotic chitinase [Aspergillus clavatus NRRL 1]EAW15054.1 bacteriodes thetaiotaomicron symbiotic chitinase [Aspergillus clavatus NRRL 1]